MAKDKRLQRLNEMAGILRDGGAASAGAQQQTAASKANKVRQLAASAAARTKGTIAGRTAAPAQAPQQAAPTKASPAFDMLAYKELVNRMLAGGQTATAGIAHPTLPKQAAGLYDATQSFQATGGAKPPMSYDDLVRRYYANAPAEGQATMAALAGRGGWQTLTPEEIAAMTSQDSYMPGEGVSAWDWIVNPDVRGGMREGYVNMLTNAQAATAHGVFDTPQYLLGGQVQYVSDDYLQHMMQILPGLIEQEEVDYPARLAAEEAAADFVQAALAPSDANVSILYMYGALDELDEEDPLGFEQALIAAAGTEVEPEESEAAYTAALTQLVAFDNVLHGSDVTVDGLLQMSGEERTAEVRRMVDDYYRYILAYEEFDPGLFPGKYPYAAVQEMVQTEAAAREALTPYVAQMMADPNVYALTEYDPLKYSDDDAYLVYQQVNADPSGTTITTNGFNLMTDVERAVYNYYYNTDNHGTAMAYIEVMRPILEARYRTMEQADWEYLATDNIFTGALMAAGSVGANVLSGVTMPLDVIAGLMGAGDGRANAFADFTQTVRTSQEEALGEHDWLGLEFFGRNIPQLLYSAGMSTADMGAAIALGNAMGINPLHIMAMEAAGAEYASTAGSGMSIPERAIRAGLVGGTEILTEKLPLDILTSDPTAPGYILRSILSEGIEEGVSEIAGIGIDAVISFAFDHASEVEDRYTFLRMNGYENAAQIVLGELAQQVGLASTVGGLAGGGMAAGSAAANFGVNALQGRGVKTAGGVERLLELGQAMGTDTASFTLATQLAEAMGGQGKAGTGQRVSAAKLGQLYRTMLTETVSQYHDDIRGMTVDAVMQALEDKYASLGEMLEGEYANNPRAIAEAIVDAKGNPNAMRGALAQYIKSHRGTREVMQEFREGSAWQRQLHEQQIGRQIGMIQQVSAIEATKTKAKGSEVQPTGETIAEETTARVQQLTRRKKSSEIPSQDVIIRDGDGQQKATIKRVERQRSGLRLIVDKGGEEVAVTMDQVEEISGTGTARVIAYAEGRPEVSDNEINAMIRMVNEQELDSSRVIAAFEAGTNAGYASAERPDMAAIIAGVKKADADALRRIMEMGYEAGSAERTTTEETRLQKAKGRKGSRAEARVSYIGDFSTMEQVSEGGVHLSTERIRGQLDAQQNAAIDVMTQVSKALGVNVAFYRSTAERGEAVEMPNGWYDDATTTVYIDLNAGANEGGQGAVQRAIIQTAAHELTHFIEANSEGGYSQLRDIARQHLTRDGVGYMDLVLDKVRKSKQQLSRAQAEAEVIADACELMLTNSQVMQEVVKQNRSIARKVASFVKTFVRRLRRAMGVIAPTTHESAMLTKEKDGVLQYAQELQSAWDRALLEAAGYQAEAPSTEGAQAVMDAAGQSAAAAAVVAQQTMHRATVSVTDRVPAVEKVAKAAAEGVAEQLADESGAGVTLPMAEAMVTEVAEAAVSAVQDAAATMAQRMDADAYLQRAADVADEVTKDMGPQAREYANAIALTTMGTYTGETPMAEELQDAMDDTSAYAQELGLTGEQQDEIRDGILQRLQTMARELGMADVQGSFEAQVLETATDKAVSTALAVYTGGRSNVAGMMEAMARRAAREAVEQQLFETEVNEAAQRTLQFSYAGRGGKTANSSLLTKAMKMQADGASADEVRKATGWFRSMDGQWRYEIDDSRATILETEIGIGTTLGDILRHDDLYRAYPAIRDIPVRYGALLDEGGAKGAYDGRVLLLNRARYARPGSNAITASDELMDTLLHEIQHAIQDMEGFASGSNVDAWALTLQQAREDAGIVAPTDSQIAAEHPEETNAFLRASMAEVHAGRRTIPEHFAAMDSFYDKYRQQYIDEYYAKRVGRRNDGLIRRLMQQMQSILSEQTSEMRSIIEEYEEAEERLNALGFDGDMDAELEIMQQMDGLRKRAEDISAGVLNSYMELSSQLRKARQNNPVLNAVELYQRTAGEIEARDTEKRARLDEQGRMAVAPDVDPDAVFAEDVQFSERAATAPSLRQTLMDMDPEGDMTQVERALLTRYQADVREYGRLQEEIDRQTQILNSNPDKDEERAARNRMGVLKSQQRRVENRLYKAEKNGGFARLISRYSDMVRAYMAGDTAEAAAQRIAVSIRAAEEQLKALRGKGGDVSPEALEDALVQLVDKKQMAEAVKVIRSTWATKMTSDEIRRRLVVYHAMMIDSDLTKGDELKAYLEQWVRDMAEKSDRTSETGAYTLDLIRAHLAGELIIDEGVAEEIRRSVGSIAEYRRVVGSVLGTVRLAKAHEKGTADSLAEEAPEWVRSTLFGDATNEADIAVQLYHVIKKAKAAEDVYAGAEGAEQMAAEVAQLIEIAEGASIRENATGRAQKILQQLRTARGKQAVTDTIIDSVIADLREARGKAREFARKGSVRDVINYLTRLERQAALQTELEQLHRMQERLDDTVRAWYAERELMEERRKLHGAIRRQVEWMDKRIRRETDRDRIPEGLKPVVDEAMRIFLAANDALQVFPRKQVEAIRGIYERVRTLHGDDLHQMDDLLQADLEDALDQLRLKLDAYAETAKTASRMDRLRARVDVLKDIQDVVMEIRKAVDDADNLLIGGQQKKLAEVTAELERELVARKDYSVAAWGGKAWESIKRLMRDGNLTPPYFFRWLGSKVMTALNQDLLDAQSKHAKLFAQAQERIAEIQKKHNYWAWRDRAPLTFVTQQGVMSGEADKHRVTLTADEALSLWVTWQREQASSPLVSSFHLPDGGFVLASKERRTKDGRIVYDGTPHKITLADMAIIGDYLTKEMRDYADEMVRYLSTDMARLGNEVSMQLFGINKYTESYYFPMRVAGGQLDESSTAARRANDETNRIAGMSASKRRVDKATKALVIGGFTDVAAQHVHNMLLYNTFSIPIENFNRILNQIHKTSDDDETASKMNMRGLLEQKIGQDMTDYLRTYLADVNGGPMADRRGKGFWNKTVSLYKRSAVMASLAVAVQQPLSMIRAMMVMPARYFVPILRNKDKVKVRKEWEQLKQYSGTALIKERGGFDMTGGRGLAAQLAGNPEDVYTLRRTVADAAKAFTEGTEGERAKRAKTAAGAIGRRGENLAGFLANKADQVAWTYIWVAVKAETADRYKGMDVESDAFLELAAKRFDEVINLTQVYDSTLVRSHNMRDKSVWMQMVTSFMAEPTLTANILMDAARQKSPKAMGKAAVIFLASQVLTAAVKAVVTAGRDDDEEKPWLEKYLAAVGSQLFGLGGSLNVLNLFPWVQDAISIIEGYDVERADMSVIDTLYTEISKLLAGKYDDKPYAAVENLGGAVATMLGLPLKNILRDARTLWNTAEHVLTEGRDVSGTAIMDDLAANMALLPDRDNGWYGERLFRALESGDEAEVAELREYLAITGKSESAIDDMVRGVIKTRLLTGQMSADEAKSFLVEHGLAADNKAAYTYVDRWTEAVDHMTEDGTLEEGYSYSAYNSLYEAIDGGNVPDVNAVVKELKANGYLTDKGTIKSTLRNRYRDTFRDLYRTNRTAFASLQNMLIAAMVAAGVSRSDAQEYLRGWLQD